MLRRWLFIIFSTLLLAGVTCGAFFWGARVVRSLRSRRAPIGVHLHSERPASSLATQTVLVVISGLRDDLSEMMPTLADLRKRGAWATVRVQAPTYAQATWTTLLSGAGPEISGTDLLADRPNDIGPITIDHLFGVAVRAGLRVALVGHRGWEPLLPEQRFDALYITDHQADSGDGDVVEAALRILADLEPHLLLVHLDQANAEGRRSGALSDQAMQAVLRTDARLREIVKAMDLERACLIITADHGQTDAGGYGGDEEAVTEVPFVAVGAGITPGRVKAFDQADIAPTIATILGAPVPALCQGNVILDALEISAETRARARIAQAGQRAALAEAYLRAIDAPPLSEAVKGDLEVASRSFEAGNYRAADQLALFSLKGAHREMAMARQSLIFDQRLNRAPLGFLAILLPLPLVVHRTTRHRWRLLLCAALVPLVYRGIHLGPERVNSFSDFPSFETLIGHILGRATVSVGLGGLLALAATLLSREFSPVRIWESLLTYGLLACCLMTVPVAISFVLNGLVLTWFVPEPWLLFMHIASLLRLSLTTLALLALPWPVVLLGLVAGGIGRLLRRPQRLVKSIAEAE